MDRKKLTEEEAEESLRFVDGALAAEGIFAGRPEVRADARAARRGEITFDEAVRRAAELAMRGSR